MNLNILSSTCNFQFKVMMCLSVFIGGSDSKDPNLIVLNFIIMQPVIRGIIVLRNHVTQTQATNSVGGHKFVKRLDSGELLNIVNR